MISLHVKSNMARKLPSRRPYVGSGNHVVPLDAPGMLGDIVRSMLEMRVPPREPEQWRPSCDAEFISKHMDKAQGEALMARTREWYAAQPPQAPPVHAEIVKVNYEPILQLQKRHGVHRPPPDETVQAMREAGYPEVKIDKYLRWWKKMEDMDEERQKALDIIFAKYPSASKPDPKKKQVKVIKAVKKKMNNE